MPRAKGLRPKHHKALALIDEGLLSYADIARAINMSPDSFYALCEGDVKKMGSTAALFKSELNKIRERDIARTKHVVSGSKKNAVLLMDARLKDLKKKKKLTGTDIKEITRITNTLNKTTPQVSIGSLNTFQQNFHLSERELKDEFQRLNAIARDALVRGRVPGPSSKGEGGVSSSFGEGDPTPEES